GRRAGGRADGRREPGPPLRLARGGGGRPGAADGPGGEGVRGGGGRARLPGARGAAGGGGRRPVGEGDPSGKATRQGRRPRREPPGATPASPPTSARRRRRGSGRRRPC